MFVDETGFFSLAARLGPQGMVQLAFPHPQVLRCNLQQLVIVDKLEAFLQCQRMD